MIARELRYFLVALQFLTRVPVPSFSGFKPEWLDHSAKYFPLIGLLVGAASAAVLWAASGLWPTPIPAVLAVAAGIALTGAFHEDGLADTADGLGGGTTREARLTIMKDSRIGTYGTVTLVVMLLLKISALSTIPLTLAIPTLIAAHAAGRLAGVLASAALPYAGDVDAAKVKPLATRHTPAGLCVATIFGLLPILALPVPLALAALGFAAIAAALISALAHRLIDGYTGDVLGAIEQVVEVVFLLALQALVILIHV